MTTTSLCWFRRDLRLDDHAAIHAALRHSERVICVFVFDRDILEGLPRQDRRVDFIWHALVELKQALRQCGSDLVVSHGRAVEDIPALAREYGAGTVWASRDCEPAARQRDEEVAAELARHSIRLKTVKDRVIFEQDEVLNGSGKPYTVFTPYRNAWLKKLTPFYLQAYPSTHYLDRLAKLDETPLPTLAELGFADSGLKRLGIHPGMSGAATLFSDFAQRIDRYQQWRDFPAAKGVSYLSAHLRFGTISIRQLAQFAWQQGNAGALKWLDELIWREFYQQLLWHYPRVAEESFKPEYRQLAFPNDEDLFAAWCRGRTGYPLIDAAMRQLEYSGYMHNRLRMVTASFLVKDLLIDWRWGERHFAEKLIDYDLAANNGGWQWAASTGCDAQPWFRIFNPVAQSQKFDPEGKFIRRYLPELAGLDNKAIHAPWQAKMLPPGFRLGHDYPAPIVDHSVQREKALVLFGQRHKA
ncbi:deoxyribodipyrimidine photo-lyase [Pseudogulbenkiania sp. MAI-1]|uniref:cryptochrome/photolyase family protein n=1 Tax=Pseudogulbenkiania sp. MAI-1 TaxID=990370 RepID=UPI00045E7553|nr:deoxyribodipyrimidine photo-lyase [Pseudogulbenkiania sp. MAI-1]